MDLFDAAAEARAAERAPLAVRIRPRRLDEVCGQAHLIGPGGPLRRLIEADALRSVILWGPPGVGKTTLAMVIAETTAREFETLSAVTAGVKDVREVIERARRRLGTDGRATTLFLDEIHRFNRSQQDALLPAVEAGTITLIGATTENPFFELNTPLLSRALLFRLEPLGDDDLRALLVRALEDPRGLAETDVDDDAAAHLISLAAGDGRRLLTVLEVAASLAAATPGSGAASVAAATPGSGAASVAAATGERVRVALADAEAAASIKALAYDKGADGHYDVTSAFIKSMRGSDPDATLHWLARMLAAGEDPRFIARRMVIFASEDVGAADPRGLLVAVGAAQALDFVGLPEARLNLAQAAVYLACAPKSNAVYVAINAAQADLDTLTVEPVPLHLRNADHPGERRFGYGEGYRYPHDYDGGWVEQTYAPPAVAGRRYFVPTGNGYDRWVPPAQRRAVDESGPGPDASRAPEETASGESARE